ncbi:MAG: LytS/YhcK type 5TM receptor domain-containing protein [Candidatus Bathyarchaeia archaeon]|jgi:sigma-B regulation protein RsbU (phosphoserine phosphatase)
MVDLTALTSTLALLSTAALIIIIALICLRTKPFNPSAKSGISKISIGILLGLLAVFATLMGTKLPDGTIINVRELAVMIAGIAGGPISGVIAGIIGGLHRYTVGGATALPCTISTVAIGLISGLVWMKISGKNSLIKAGLLGLSLESMAMGLILVLVQPLDVAIGILSQIAIPMIAATTIGLIFWVYLFSTQKSTTKTLNS